MFVYCADYVKKHSFLHRCAFLLHFKKVDYQVGKKEKHFFFLILISSPYFLALEKKKKFFFSKPPFPFKDNFSLASLTGFELGLYSSNHLTSAGLHI